MGPISNTLAISTFHPASMTVGKLHSDVVPDFVVTSCLWHVNRDVSDSPC